ncbi:tubulin polyglutamylase TTLL7-like isoform X1 [Mytilus trossulus]|uniref:tubulin polyglutamylase TTLL7-like isoform X1 n=3 Tax=Mytilus trossulus TaxID=6551 RepID=UPI0030058435
MYLKGCNHMVLKSEHITMPSIKQSGSLSSLADRQDVSLSSLTSYARKLDTVAGQANRRVDNKHVEFTESDRPKSASSPKKKRKKKNPIIVNLSGTRYEVIRQMAEKLGFTPSKDDDPNGYLIWNDSFVSAERINELKPFQRINHFPGMGEITRKDCLARNMLKVSKEFPEEYGFIPKSWILPSDYSQLVNYSKDLKSKKKSKTFIIKPSNGAQGHGIQLFKNAEKIPATEHFIVQEYIEKPFLLDGYKFDLRIYVLITSCDPLRVFLFNDGLVRMSTEKYQNPAESNINHMYMHLTNYSVNKHNEYYEKGESVDSGSKRSIAFLNEYLRNKDRDVALMWRNISDMIVKTLLVSMPHLLHAYRMCRPCAPSGSDSVCFEVLGFDVLLDRNLKPWLLEINRSPSFGTDEKIDWDIKSALIENTIKLLNIKVSDKRRNINAQKQEAQKRLYRTGKRPDAPDVSEYEKRRIHFEKRKEELKELLARIKKQSLREDYDNRNMGKFRRIFPTEDKARQEKYVRLMSSIFNIFMSGRAPAMQKEIQRIYKNPLREEDVLDMLHECEEYEKDGKYAGGGKGAARGPKPLQSMPVCQPSPIDDSEEDDDEMTEGSPMSTPMTRRRSAKSRPGSMVREQSEWSEGASSTYNSRPNSGVRSRPPSNMSMSNQSNQRSRSLSRMVTSGKYTSLQRSTVDDGFLTSVVKEREDELSKKTLIALNDMRIKFPGKSDEEAEMILDKLHESWKFHKPRIASYWLVKLDSIKRRKVIDIVRSNVRAVLQRTWRVSDVDNLRIYRIFSRVFSRLLWSHGQGLWNCFSSSNGPAGWETIFSKSTENISESDMNCCRRIVQLCRDCLLIVYQFAAEAKNTSQSTTSHSDTEPSGLGREKPISLVPPNTQTMSQRYSKLYRGEAS